MSESFGRTGLNLKGIVIDMDGTITRFNLDYMSARRRTLDELDKHGLRTPDMNDQVSLWVVLKKLQDTLKPEEFRKLRDTCYVFFEEMEVKAAHNVSLYPGAVDALRELRSKSLKLGLVTNNSRAGTDLTLKRLNLQSLFDAIVTRDDCEEMKPAPAPILKILAEIGVSPESAIFVGDGVMDVTAAKAAGVRSVAVTTGPFPVGRLLKAEPDYVLNSVRDLPSLVENLVSEDICN
jgi:HAD superfamily hydrolase (TIGR01662 family)